MDAEQREAWLKALRSERFFVRSADPCFLVSVEADGRFVMRATNAAHERATGLSREQVADRDVRDILPAELCEVVLSRMQRCAEQLEEKSFDDDLSFPAGRRLWKTRLVPLPGPDGRAAFLLGSAHDLTDQFWAETELRQTESGYRQLVETLHEGIWKVDENAHTTFVNPRMADMLGHEGQQMLGRRMVEFVDPSGVDVVERSLKNRTAGMRETFELELVRSDGTRIPVLLSTSPLFDADGNHAGAVAGVQDLTELRAAIEQRRALERKLQEAQKLESLGLLAGGIAHDFNNILTGILGSASLARMDGGLPDGIDRHLKHVELSAQRAAELCKQMLAYAGKGKFVVERLDLSSVVRDTTELLRVSIDKNATIRFELMEGLPFVEADVTQLRQVLMNLVINASEALVDPAWNKPGVITLATGSQESDGKYFADTKPDPDLPPGRYVFLEVADNGPGMSPATIEKIFDPFFSTKFTGRGLGLSAVLGIVRGHRGAIKVYSELGRGTTFKLLFPAVRAGVESARAPPTLSSAPQLSGTILVVDDEELVCQVLRSILQRLGFEVVTANDGQQALEAIRRDPEAFSVVLMDLTMPNMDGVSAFRELRQIKPDVRMILMSGYNEQEAISRFSGKGLAGFLQKPFSAQALRDKLRTVLE